MNENAPVASVAAAAGDRAKVFVSYSRKDSAFAQMLVGALAERGFDAFLDKTDIAPGEPQKERLEESCAADFFIGVRQIELGSPADARPSLQSAADHCPHDFVQDAAAQLELKRLDEQAGAQAK